MLATVETVGRSEAIDAEISLMSEGAVENGIDKKILFNHRVKRVMVDEKSAPDRGG